jgi:type IV pilus assembly protein PilV
MLKTMNSSPHPSFRHIRLHQKGATLIEVLVAVLIFSFGLLGLIGLQSRAMQFSGNAEDRNRASALAAEAATDLYTLRGGALPAATVTAWKAKVSNAASGGLPNVDMANTDITVGAPVGGYPVYNIVITWQAPNSPVSNFSTQVMGMPAAIAP